jgi:hypothetical protein
MRRQCAACCPNRPLTKPAMRVAMTVWLISQPVSYQEGFFFIDGFFTVFHRFYGGFLKMWEKANVRDGQ